MNPQDFDPSTATASAQRSAALEAIRDGKPSIRLPGNNHYLSVFAEELGRILAPVGFYNFNGVCSRIEYNRKLQSFELVRVAPQAFRSMIEAYCVPFAITKREQEFIRFNKGLSTDHATATLVSPNFLTRLPYLAALNFVRLPIRRDNGQIQLLPEGYDPF
jgi:hypothetical protein